MHFLFIKIQCIPIHFCKWDIGKMIIVFYLIACFLSLYQTGAFDYEKEWPTTSKADWKDFETPKIIACKNKCPKDDTIAMPNETSASPSMFAKEKFDKVCAVAPASMKCMMNCYDPGRWRNLARDVYDGISYQCSPAFRKHLACYKTVHEDKTVAKCISGCVGPKLKGKIYDILQARCKHFECESKCQKPTLLTKCQKEGLDSFAKYVKQKVQSLKFNAWVFYHIDKNKKITFSDTCDKIFT